MSLVVSDTSPIRALAFLHLLDLLHELYQDVWIPPSVTDELARQPEGLLLQSNDWPWLKIQAPANHGLVAELQKHLDAGESEAIVLAEEISATVVLIDELRGRKVAVRMGLETLGTLGILAAGKRTGRLAEVRPLILQLRDGRGFFLSDRLIERVLKDLGEA